MTPHRPLFWTCLKAVARPLVTVLFDLKVYGREHVPPRGGVLIVSNHQGNLDPVLLGASLDRPLNYIAKSELFENPFGARLLRALNAFPVRQGAGDVGAIKETIHRLREGHVLNIYPEGARTEDGEIAPLQRGVAAVLRRCDVPVVPAVIVGSFEAWPIHREAPTCWPIRVEFGPPLSLAGLPPDEVLATLDRTLRAMYEALRRRTPAAAEDRLRRRAPGGWPPHGHQPAEVRRQG